MGTNYGIFVADLFLTVMRETSCCFFSDDNQSKVIEALNNTFRYLNYLLNIENNIFDSTINHIYLQNFN